MQTFTRRDLFAAALASGLLHAKGENKIGRSRISAITDEIARSPEDAIAFAKQYGLQWVELRNVPGTRTDYVHLPDDGLRAAAKQFRDAGLKVSFLNTALLKFSLPGTVPPRKPETDDQKAKRIERDQQSFERRTEDLQKALHAARVFEVDKVRIFTFSRVAEPEQLFPKIAEVIEPMVRMAEKEGIHLLVENEGSQNVATGQDAARFVKLIQSPWLGINWDPQNAIRLETPFPDGYKYLPIERVLNVQMKAKGLLEGPERLDWAGIVHALERDGYGGKIGLETHIFDGTLIEKAHASMREIMRIVEPS